MSRKIYKAQIWNIDGRAIQSTEYFEDYEDACDYNGHPHSPWAIEPIEVKVWEKGERSNDSVKRNKILSKLTQEEREFLGLE